MTLPPIPQHRDWSKSTWRAGLDEAVRRNEGTGYKDWKSYSRTYAGIYEDGPRNATIAHAITLLDAGIVKPMISEAEKLFRDVIRISKYGVDFIIDLDEDDTAAIAVIQAALDKARAGE